MRLGIKAKQVAGVTSIVTLSIVALGLIHLASLARVALEESKARGELLKNAILHRASVAISEQADPYQALRDDAGLRSILESSLYSKSVIYAAIVDAEGRVVAHSDPSQIGQRLPNADELDPLLALNGISRLRAIYSDAGRTLEVRERLILKEEQRQFGSIRVGISTLLIQGELNAALGPALLTLAVALVIAVVVAMLLAQLLLRPIHIIRSGLTRLGRGEFGVTLDLPKGDEFGDLGSFFNEISAQLSADRSNPGQGQHNRDQVLQALNYSRKLVALGRLTTGVAHEVKNPLNAMTIHLELLRQKLTADAGRARRPATTLLQEEGGGAAVAATEPQVDLSGALRHASVIGDEIKRLDQVLQGFMKFTRPEELKIQSVEVRELIGEVSQLVEAEARKTGVRIVVECPSDVPPIHVDSAMMRQALLNLAINACQAMPDGGTLRMSSARARESRVQITVSDTGVGIKPEDLNRIFDLYFTTKERGSGIGLSLVYRIIQMHDGEVEVESAPGRGTTFKLVVPRATD
jgi:signal transduction histidine kinase